MVWCLCGTIATVGVVTLRVCCGLDLSLRVGCMLLAVCVNGVLGLLVLGLLWLAVMFVLVVDGGCRLLAGCFINLGWWVRVRGWVFGWCLIGVVWVVLELV